MTCCHLTGVKWQCSVAICAKVIGVGRPVVIRVVCLSGLASATHIPRCETLPCDVPEYAKLHLMGCWYVYVSMDKHVCVPMDKHVCMVARW